MLVFLHGFAGTPAIWDDVPIAGTRLTIPVRESWDATLDALAVPADAIVVGYSMGARLALGLLARDAIRAAILISVNPGLPEAQRPARRAADARWAAMLRTEGIAAFVDAWAAQPLFASQASVAPERLAQRRAARLALDPEMLARSLETTGLAEMPDLAPALIARARRAHLIVGGLDAKFVGIAADLAARAPELVVEVIEKVGHDPTLESPSRLTDLVTRAAARW